MMFKKTFAALAGCLVMAAVAGSAPVNAAAPSGAAAVQDQASTVEKATYGDGRNYRGRRGHYGDRGHRGWRYGWNHGRYNKWRKRHGWQGRNWDRDDRRYR